MQNIVAKNNDRGILFWIGMFVIVMMMVLAGACTKYTDLEPSIWEYDLFSNTVYQGEWFNFFIKNIFRGFGADYEIYRLFLYIAGYILIFSTISKFFGFSFYTIILYALYPFPIDAAQTPNFCCYALFIFSTRYLVNCESTKNRFLYILFCLMAAGMHTMGYVYLPILALVVWARKKNVVTYGLVFGVLGLSTGIMDKAVSLLPKIVYMVSQDARLSLYFESSTRFGFLLYWAIMILVAVISFMAYKSYSISKFNISSSNQTETDDERKKYLEVVFLVACYGLLLMPLVSYAGTVFRIIRNTFILLYASWGAYVSLVNDVWLRGFLRIIFLAFPVFMFMIESEYVKQSFFGIFVNNWLIIP